MADDLIRIPAAELALARPAAASPFIQAAEQVIAAKASPRTRVAYRGDLKAWLSYCTAVRVDPAQASYLEAAAFRDRMLNQRAPGSVHRACASLSSIYASVLVKGQGQIVAANPFAPDMLKWPSGDALHLTPAVADADADLILKHCVNDSSSAGLRDAAICYLLYSTALRRMSVAALRRDQIEGEPPCEKYGLQTVVKGGRQSAMKPIVGAAALALTRWLMFRDEATPQHPFLFPGDQEGFFSLAASSVTRIVARRARAAGVKPTVSPHQFRAAWITRAYDEELPEHEIQAAADHVRAETTRRYDRKARGANAIEAVAAARERDKNQ